MCVHSAVVVLTVAKERDGTKILHGQQLQICRVHTGRLQIINATMNKRKIMEALYIIRHNLTAPVNNDPDFPDNEWLILSRVMEKRKNEHIFSNQELKEVIEYLKFPSIKEIEMITIDKHSFVQIRAKKEEVLEDINRYKTVRQRPINNVK